MHHTRRAALLTGLALLSAGAAPQPLAPSGLPFTVRMPDDFPAATRAEALQWLARSAAAVTLYLGRFPAPQVVITLTPFDGWGVRSGVTFDGPPIGIRVTVGRDTPRERFLDDWIMVHEMVHLAVSQMPRQHNWFHEGIATYGEIIARARAGLTSAESAWDQLMANLHHGLPVAGEGGLDNTRRWGRTYWGGALFCLLADLEIRQRTDNRLGLQDALAGLVRAGSHYGQRWPIERTLQSADSAVGTPVLMDMYARMKDQPVATDLPRLFQDLGLHRGDGPRQLRADAPRTSARRAILPE